MLGTGHEDRKPDPEDRSDPGIDSKNKEALEIIQESKAIGHDIAILSTKYKVLNPNNINTADSSAYVEIRQHI